MSTTALTATLEAIFNIVRRHKVARSKEIADSLKIKRPTVMVALRALAQKGYINQESFSSRLYNNLALIGAEQFRWLLCRQGGGCWFDGSAICGWQ